jgi:transcriptional regulator with XRE-family HTH domain
VSKKGSLLAVGTYNNEIEQFIYTVCYRPMWEAAYRYISEHPYALNLSYSRIQNPDSAMLEDMILEFAKNIRIDEDSLLFDAVVSCTINLTEENYGGTASHEISQWLVLSCVAVVTEKLESITVTNISSYASGQPRKTDGQAVSKNIVPILYKKDMDDEATAFLQKYYPEALEAPMPVPIADIAKAMELDIVQGSRITDDFSIFGEIYFTSGKATLYDLFKISSDTIDVKRGTILVDAYTFWERNLGCVKNTIAHEVYHWYKHRMYAAIKHILYGQDFVACRCPSSMTYPKKNEEWTDVQRMEWQANNMAPRILMPYRTFRMKVDELLEKFNYAKSPIKPAVLTAIAEELREFYGVSKQSVLIRMMETGYKDAATIYQYDEASPYHSYLDQRDAFYAYRTNDEFRDLVDSGLFRYVDGHFVINDEKYVERDDNGKFTLTDYAWSNLEECTLQFTWQALRADEAEKHFPFELLHRDNADRKASKYDSQKSALAVQMSEQLRKKREEFERQSAARKITGINKTCWEVIFEILQSRGISKSHFCSATGLGEEVYRKAEKNIDTKPSLRTIVAIGRGLDLDIGTTEKLLQLARHAFDESDEQQALKYCITGFSGMGIDDANEFLESYNYEPLGSKQRL